MATGTQRLKHFLKQCCHSTPARVMIEAVSVLRRWSLINRSTILAFFTFKSIAKHADTTGNRGHPRPIHPRWVMPNMLVVPAYELCDPMSLMVLVIAGNTTQPWSAVFYRWIGRFHNTSQSVTLGLPMSRYSRTPSYLQFQQ